MTGLRVGVVVLALGLAVSSTAAAESSVEANGYGSLRLEYSAPRTTVPLGGLLAFPSYRLLVELNSELRITYTEGYDVHTDISLFYSDFIDDRPDGALPEISTDTRGPTFLINELYQSLGFHEHLTALVGKKRIVWGTGFSWNPTDVLNVAVDPTDPTLQRVGAWLVSLEVPFASWTLTTLFAPNVLETTAGLPSRVLLDEDDKAHYLIGARAYALIADSDISLMYYFTDRYGDEVRHQSHFGVAFSRLIFDLELHFEGIARLGSSRAIMNPDCLETPPLGFDACARANPPTLVLTPEVDSKRFFFQVLVGARYMFKDSSLLNVEYYYNHEGLNAEELDDRLAAVDLVNDLISSGLAPEGSPAIDPSALFGGSGGDEAGTPSRFAFNFSRRHYLFITYQKPTIRDDFTWSLFLIAGLQDFSGVAGTSLTWSARSWLSFQAFAFVPFGPKDSEFGELPTWARVSLEARAYY